MRRFCYGFHARDWRSARAGAPLPVRFEPIGPSWLRAGPIPARAIFGSRAPEAFWPHAHGLFVRLEKRTEIWCTKKKRAPLHDFLRGFSSAASARKKIQTKSRQHYGKILYKIHASLREKIRASSWRKIRAPPRHKIHEFPWNAMNMTATGGSVPLRACPRGLVPTARFAPPRYRGGEQAGVGEWSEWQEESRE